MKPLRLLALSFCLAWLAGCDARAPTATAPDAAQPAPEAMSLSGRPLFPPSPLPDAGKLEADLAEARRLLESNPDDPDALIWVGRRLGYLWRYHEAIDAFSRGIERWPDDARFLRHRGHRYLSVRDFPRAQADLERTAALIRGRPDEVEPDGMPNPAGIPRSTLAYNIWYHLGLAHYLQADHARALDAFGEALAVSDNDDSIVAATDWMWMSAKRLGRDDLAADLLERITPDMDLLENDGYHRRLLMYKGLLAPDALLAVDNDDPVALATQGYGVANYHLVNGEPEQARAVLAKILAGRGWNAFGYLAAEADMARIGGEAR